MKSPLKLLTLRDMCVIAVTDKMADREEALSVMSEKTNRSI